MNKTFSWSVLAIVALVFLSTGIVFGMPPDERPITEKDLFHFTWIADPQISPDGSRVAFVRVTVNEKADRYDTCIWTVYTKGGETPERLTNGPRDTSPRWSPDGKRLAFIRGSEKDSKPPTGQLYLMPTTGGEPRLITRLPKGVASLAWSPDGGTIVFTSRTTAEDLKKAEQAKKAGENSEAAKDEKPAEHESDVRVVAYAVYRSNSEGYLDPKRRSHLWLVKVPQSADETPVAKLLTFGDFDEREPTWAPDGKLLYFVSNRVPEPYYEPPDSDLYSVPAVGGEIRRIASIDGTIGEISPSPDGRRIAFRGVISRPIRSYNQPDLFITDITSTSSPRNLTETYDFDIGSGLIADQRTPRGSLPVGPIWTRDGRSLLMVASEKGRANLQRIDIGSGRVEPLTKGDQEIISYTATPDGSKIAALLSTATNIGDLFVVEASSGAMKQITHVNEPLFSQIKLTPPEEFWYTSFDGRKIQRPV